MTSQNPSLYEMLTLNFGGELDLQRVSERDQVILSVLDNMQRILNSRAGTLAHLPDYGLPDMSQILQGMPGSAHGLLSLLSATLLKYEPRLESLSITLLPQTRSGHLEYTLEARLKELGLVRFGTEFAPEGKVLVRHLKQQQFVSA
ncbi:type VI secretion system baseplate subunit TssE [Hafnia alvei]|jgi:type VI secretion system protein|uniref:Type VI secretion system baseplate subunit TssE n=1 Tax=Hafnia alvei TaxID=569 RepID=A0ABD7Q8A2_HAFAL|nr:type VI secretion system baseplate subunit TssE [Hafnia alvei]KAA0261510.1 type VI secretion system baseplate subunit TssE [Hafnia alvei]MBI0275357.1 type VI secretion system baseplate subunit TssE [Hafnia alvei]PNK98644.1 type VI secretion system baseplate subunit TssE [Hafnia alvei]TBL67021.1 type VI secretion system baseplate subunit TssE [Hafnia alvei]STQ71535.1 type VI secretion system lysozyme-like protein [Hafnia alvei]